MGILIKNYNWTLSLCLSLLRILGVLVPEEYKGGRKLFLEAYCIFWYAYINGIYIIIQTGDLFQIWGDLSLVVRVSFVLFTNVAFGMKYLNIVIRRNAVQAIIDEGNEELRTLNRVEEIEIIESSNPETSRHYYLYIFICGVVVFGFGASAEKGSLPLRAWYPYDTSKSPAYELTYFHQVTAIMIGSITNASLDTIVTSLIAVCRCRLRLIRFHLRTLCDDMPEIKDNESFFYSDNIVMNRLNSVVTRHQAVLKTVKEIQRCFGEPILAQLTVSLVIICVTAYQMAEELYISPKHILYFVSMTTYFIGMILQVYLYCNQGHQLSIESSDIATAAYACRWHSCSPRFRRALLIVMTRSKQECRITACGLTTLSLTCFTALIKASYSFFTVLQQVEEKKK